MISCRCPWVGAVGCGGRRSLGRVAASRKASTAGTHRNLVEIKPPENNIVDQHNTLYCHLIMADWLPFDNRTTNIFNVAEGSKQNLMVIVELQTREAFVSD